MFKQGFFSQFCVITAQGVKSIGAFYVAEVFKNDQAVISTATVRRWAKRNRTGDSEKFSRGPIIE